MRGPDSLSYLYDDNCHDMLCCCRSNKFCYAFLLFCFCFCKSCILFLADFPPLDVLFLFLLFFFVVVEISTSPYVKELAIGVFFLLLLFVCAFLVIYNFLDLVVNHVGLLSFLCSAVFVFTFFHLF